MTLALPDRPSPEIIERALAAAKETQRNEQRCRYVALDALLVVFPSMTATRLALHLAYKSPASASALIATAKGRDWWDESHVDHVIGTLVADQYGERAL